MQRIVFLIIALSADWAGIFAGNPTGTGDLNVAGKAYLTKVLNNSPFPMNVKISGKELTLKHGGTLGMDSQAEEAVSILGQFVAPLVIDQKTHLQTPEGKISSPLSGQPEFSGSYTTNIGAISPEMGIAISAMRGQGLATLSGLPIFRAWETPQQDKSGLKLKQIPSGSPIRRPGVTFSFFVWMAEQGQFSIKLLETESTYFQVNLSCHQNGISSLSRVSNGAEKILLSSRELSFLAGNYTQFWISIDRFSIVVGQGDPGKNPLLIYNGPECSRIAEIGLTTGQVGLALSNPQISSALYASQSEEGRMRYFPMASAGRSLPAGKIPLREKGRIAIALDRPEKITLLNKQHGAHLEIKFDHQRKTVSIFESDKEIGNGSWHDLPSDQQNRQFLVWSEGSRLFVAQETQSNERSEYPAPGEFQLIAVAQSKTLETIDSVETSGGLGLELFDQLRLLSAKAEQSSSLFAKTNIVIKKDFKYKLIQDGQAILVKDLIYDKTWVLASAPQQQAIYPVSFNIKPNGTPDVFMGGSSVNPVKWGIMMTATLYQVDMLTSIVYAQKLAQTAAPEVKANIKLTSANINECLGAAASGALASAATAMATNLFRSGQSYVFKDKAPGERAYSTEKDLSILESNLELDSIIERVAILQISNSADFDYACNLYMSMMDKIIDARMISPISKEGFKQKTVDGIVRIAEQLPIGFTHSKDIEKTYQGLSADQGNFWLLSTQVIALLVLAIRNKAFLDPSVEIEKYLLDRLFAALSSFSRFMTIKYLFEALNLQELQAKLSGGQLGKKEADSASALAESMGGLGGLASLLGGGKEQPASSNVTSSAESKTEALTIPSTQGLFLNSGVSFDPKTGLYIEFSLRTSGKIDLCFLGLSQGLAFEKASNLLSRQLDPILQKQLPPGSRLYSIGFDSQGIRASLSLDGPDQTKVYGRDNPDARLSGFKFTDFWVSFCNGKLELGVLSPTKKTLISLSDHYFHTSPLYTFGFLASGSQSYLKINSLDAAEKQLVTKKLDPSQNPLVLIAKVRSTMKDFGVLTDLEKQAYDANKMDHGLNAAVMALDAKQQDYALNRLDSAASNFEYGSALTYSQRNVEDWSRQDSEYTLNQKLEEARQTVSNQPKSNLGLDEDAQEAREDRALRGSQQKASAEGAAGVTGEINQLKGLWKEGLESITDPAKRELRDLKNMLSGKSSPLKDLKDQLRNRAKPSKSRSSSKTAAWKAEAAGQGAITVLSGLMSAGQDTPTPKDVEFAEQAQLDAAAQHGLSR